uniref:WGS project CAEQ00000000 data, annotated contig 2383 n=1 Tax=Trypanosoma congolense (strain IL3000) TaxID=1068625 RepID=F9WDN2_TRYCI|nr:unnamed protein product [Trypanosoma congolense IL3000]
MSNVSDSGDYTGNSSSVYSVTVEEDLSVESRRTHVSVTTSLATSHEADPAAGSVTDEEEGYEYTSGYQSRTYETRTPTSFYYEDLSSQSPNSEELSSTLMGYYIDNEVVQRVKSLFVFLRKPLVFFSLVLSEPSLVTSFGRVAHTVRVATSRRVVESCSLNVENIYALPKGYYAMPECLQRARLGLPPFVESVIKSALQWSGIPCLADLQKKKWLDGANILRTVPSDGTASTCWGPLGPMLPLSFFLPLFSLAALTVARCVVSRSQASHAYEEDGGMDYGTVGSQSYRKEIVSDNFDSSNLSGLNDMFTNSEIGITKDINNSRLETPRGAPPAPGSPSSRNVHDNKHEPSEGNTYPHTVPTSRDLSLEGSATGDALKLTLSPSSDESGSVPLEAQHPGPLYTRQHTPKGDVVLAMTGEPSVHEVNFLLIAAVKYGCRKVILPSVVPASLLSSSPVSLDVVRVDDVMEHIMSAEESQGLTTVGVFLYPVTDETVELRNFTHPESVVYLFMSASLAEANVLAHLVDRSIYYSSSLDEPFPVNACLYDRLTKGRDGNSRAEL